MPQPLCYGNKKMQKLNVPPKYNNKKVSAFLLDTYKNLPQSAIFKALRKKDIRINDVKISENVVLHTNDIVTIYIVDDVLFGGSIKFSIIYEDNNILIVNKPSGIAVTESSNNEPTLTELIQKQFNNTKIMPCHRLDRNTSGLVIYAKNNDALSILLNAFKNNQINKYYKCTVVGKMEKSDETLVAYLFKDNKKSQVFISKIPKDGYRKIITHYKVIEYHKQTNTSVLEVKLETGRTHQIRAHLSSIGHPLVGDGKYGKNEINKKLGKTTQELEAYKICFNFTSGSLLEYLNKKSFQIK